MTDKHKRFFCEVILQAYDRNIMPESNLWLEKRHDAVIVRGLPFNKCVWFPYGYEEFCFGTRNSIAASCSFLDWVESFRRAYLPDIVTFSLSYQSVHNALKGVSSWEELELRLSIGGFLKK